MTTKKKLTILDFQGSKDTKAVAVLDTSVLLVDGLKLLQYLKNCTVVIPSVVITELESKRTTNHLGFFAREWLRLFEELRVNHSDTLAEEGVLLPDADNVTLRVEPNHTNQESLAKHMRDGSNDATILAVAHNLQVEYQEIGEPTEVAVVSNDVPMRLKATLFLHLQAFEFSPANVMRSDEVFDGTYDVLLSEDDLEDGSYSKKNLSQNVLELATDILPDEDERSYYSVVRVDTEDVQNAEAIYAMSGDSLEPLQRKRRVSNIVGRTFEQDAALQYLTDRNIDIVSLGGRAGTGKTLLALAAAFDQITSGAYQKVTVYKSLHEMGVGQELGFLPGGVDEKMEAWAGAIFDAIDVLAAEKKSNKKKSGLQGEEAIETEVQRLRGLVDIQPIAYLRGRSIANSFIILEEAQNFSRAEILNIISRAGDGSKIIMTWDADQVDNKYLSSGEQSDIWTVVESMRRETLFAHITLSRTERSKVSELASRLLAEG